MCTEMAMNRLREKATSSTKKLFDKDKILEVVDAYIDNIVVGKDPTHRHIIMSSRASGKNTWCKLIRDRMIERGIVLNGGSK